jgi:hypothetical protein
MINRLPALFLLAAGAYGQAQAGAGGLAEPRDAVEEQYRAWQSLQAKVYGELRRMKDPCNSTLIAGLMGLLKKEATAYFDRRAAYLSDYYVERGRAAEESRTFFAAADPLLESYDLGRTAAEQLLADDRERLKSLPPEAEKARLALERAVAMEAEHLAKIVRNLEARKAEPDSASARMAPETFRQELREQLLLIGDDAELVLNNYDSQISKYDQACVALPVGNVVPRKKL